MAKLFAYPLPDGSLVRFRCRQKIGQDIQYLDCRNCDKTLGLDRAAFNHPRSLFRKHKGYYYCLVCKTRLPEAWYERQGRSIEAVEPVVVENQAAAKKEMADFLSRHLLLVGQEQEFPESGE